MADVMMNDAAASAHRQGRNSIVWPALRSTVSEVVRRQRALETSLGDWEQEKKQIMIR